MKKWIIALLCVVMVATMCVTFVACDNSDFKIGISKFIKIPALDDASEGFKTELTRLMTEAGKTVSYKEKDAAGDAGLLPQINSDFVAKNLDMIFAIATPSVLNAASVAKDKNIPVVGTAVTQYDASLLAYGNVTGTSDMNPIEKQYQLMKLLDTQNTKKFGVLYSTSEANSLVQRDALKAMCIKDGVEFVDAGVSDKNDIKATMSQKLYDCGAIFIPTDNIMSNATGQIHSVNKETKSLRKPIVWGELAPHKESGIATYGIDYKELGKISAQMAFDILIKGAKPSDMPIRTMDKYVFNINEKVATEIGYAIPESIKALAK